MPTFEDLNMPVVIYTPNLPDGFRKTTLCRWAELEDAMRRMDDAAAQMLEQNHNFAEACEVLRPLMQANPTLTVVEALAILNTKVGP